MPLRTSLLPLAAAAALAACCEELLSRPLFESYVLQTVNGHPVPAAYDTVEQDGVQVITRITGRTVQFVDDDTAVYEFGEDTQSFAKHGDRTGGEGSCTSLPVPYRRQGDRVILLVDLQEPGVRPWADTLYLVEGDRLAQDWVTARGRTVHLEYAPADEVPAVCAREPFTGERPPPEG